MKISFATSYLLFVVAALAVLSTEGASLRGELSLSLGNLPSNAGHFDGLHRRMEDNAADDAVNAEDDAVNAEDDAVNEETDDAANAGDDAVEASDDAVVEEESSVWDKTLNTANKTITTALDPDTYTGKYNEVTDTYNSMSRSTQIWTIVLAVWFATLILSTLCYCCCGKKKIKKKELKEKLIRSDQEDHY